MNPTETKSWITLRHLHERQQDMHLKERFTLDTDRFDRFSIENDHLLFDYSKHQIDEEVLAGLLEFASEQEFSAQRNAFFSGEKINKTEDRAVLHTALRAPKDANIQVDGENVVPAIHEVLQQIKSFSDKVINGELKGHSGKPFTDVVNIGIGGSDLGAKMVVNALYDYQNHLNTHFVSNVDEAAIHKVLDQVALETTLFIVVSKTFTTIETLTNANTARKAVHDHYGDEKAISSHFAAVSTNLDATGQFGINPDHVFAFWDWVGGRYSLWSAVGLSIALAVGFDHFSALLKGAHSADEHFKKAPDNKNIPLLMALLDIWYNNMFDYRSLAVIPYSDHLALFPKFLQQLDMESNGKSTDKEGNRVDYKTANVIWGEAGTDSQHSFFQLLHQGTDIIPVDFIGVRKKGNQNDHDKILMSNLLAQSKALMEGTVAASPDISDPFNAHKQFEGNRPSTTFVLKGLNPQNLGYLIALYEHKVFTQGVLWNIFSFDQWGVQLGKKLALSIGELDEQGVAQLDSSTKGLYSFFNQNT